MSITIEDKIKENAGLSAVVEQADRTLEPILKGSFVEADAVWKIAHDQQQRQVVELRVIHPQATVAERFTPEDLNNTTRIHDRVNRLWWDFLDVLIREQLKEMGSHLVSKGEE